MNPWAQTISGAKVDLLEPDPKSIRLDDICHHLAHINRYSGATPEPYSVAEHSILVYRILCHKDVQAPLFVQLQGLLHDAHEAYTGDITTPVQLAGLGGVTAIQERLNRAILKALGLGVPPKHIPVTWSHEVYAADRQALSNEYYQWFHNKAPASWGEAVLRREDVIFCPIPEYADKHAAASELHHLIMMTQYRLRVGGDK